MTSMFIKKLKGIGYFVFLYLGHSFMYTKLLLELLAVSLPVYLTSDILYVWQAPFIYMHGGTVNTINVTMLMFKVVASLSQGTSTFFKDKENRLVKILYL